VSIGHGVVAADPAEAATLEHDREQGGDAPDQDPGSPPRRRRTLQRVAGDLVPPAIVFALFIGVWYAFSYWLLDKQRRFLVPPPHKVINTSFFNAGNRAALLDSLWLSTKVAMIGLLIAVLIGIALAVVMSQAKWAERSIYPYAVALQTVPILALTPLIGFWFDFNFKSRVIVCVIIALFPIIANTLFGLQSVDRGHHDLFRLHGAGRLTRLFKLQFPAALPAVFTGLRISAGLSVVGAIVGDFFFRQGKPGLGILIDVYQHRLQTEQMIGALIHSVLLGVVTFWIFGIIGNKVVGSWHDSGHRQS
jgi:NitT/TauT family transport system permease protein